MFNQDDPNVEVPTPAEELELLLQDIEKDISMGNLPAACRALEEIQDNQTQCNLLNRLPDLKDYYDYLNQNC
ncbi:MAG: hypothetical protein AAF215_07700 [Cyanobacteria bacterium P01_A01_bin.123]